MAVEVELAPEDDVVALVLALPTPEDARVLAAVSEPGLAEEPPVRGRLPQAPEHKLNLIGQYIADTSMGELGLRLGVSYTGDLLLVQQANNVNPGPGTLGGALGNSGLEESSRTVLDFSASLAKDNWRATFYVNNLTDELYRVAAVEQQANTALLEIYNQPRVIGVKFNYSFGDR